MARIRTHPRAYEGKGERIALLAGMEYSNMVFVRGLVKSINADRFILVCTSGNAACLLAAETAAKIGLPTEQIFRCKPHHIIPKCGVLLFLYDGVNHNALVDFADYAGRHAPNTVIRVFGSYGPIDNGVAFLRQTKLALKRGYGGFGNDGAGCLSS